MGAGETGEIGPIAIESNNRERGDSVTTNQLAQQSESEWVGKQQRIEMM
jgi:hypothetical protein